MRRAVWLSSLALLGGCVVSSAMHAAGQKDSRTDKSVPAAGIRGVRATVEIGSIKVRTDSAGEIRVAAVRKIKGGTDAEQSRWLQESKVEVERQGDSLVIKDVVPEALKREHGKRGPNATLDLEVRIPKGLSLETAMGVGDISSDGSFSALRLKTGVGDVKVSGDTGELSVVSGVGKLMLDEVSVSGSSAEINTGVGDVDASMKRIPSKEFRVRSGVGNAVVRIPSSSKASVELRSGVGTVKSDFPLTSEGRGRIHIGGAMRGQINGGGSALNMSSGTGNIHLSRHRSDG